MPHTRPLPLATLLLIASTVVGQDPGRRADAPGRSPGSALGVVVDAQGDAVADAVVSLWGRGATDRFALLPDDGEPAVEVDRTRTDARGRFALPLPDRGFFAVRAETADARSEVYRIVVAGMPLRLELAPLRTVRGSVRAADGSPVPGVTVSVLGAPVELVPAAVHQLGNLLQLDEAQAVTDADGRFTLRTTQPPGARARVETALGLVLSELPDDGPWEIRLERPRQVLITALDRQGAPLAGVELRDPFQLEQPPEPALSDADGFVGFEHHGAHVFLELRSEQHRTVRGYAERFARRLRKEIELEPARWVEFRLRDRGGAPLAGREVLARGDLPLLALDGRDFHGATMPFSTRATSDADGRTRLRWPFDEAAPVRLWVADASGRWALAQSGAHSAALEGEDVAAPTTVAVAGRVLDPDGVPRPGASVVLVGALDPEPGAIGAGAALRVALSDSAGRFRFESIETGQIGLTTLDTEHLPAWETVTLRPGASSEELVLKMRAGPRLAGRVVDSSGDPVAGARVQLRPDESLADRGGPLVPLPAAAVSDVEGRFAIPIEAGEVALSAWAWTLDGRNGYSTRTVDATRDELELVVR